MRYLNRIEEIQSFLKEEKQDFFITFHPQNYYYLTGFTGSSGACIVTQDLAFLITDGRYVVQAKEQILLPEIQVEIQVESLLQSVTQILERLKVKSGIFESEHLPYATVQMLKKQQHIQWTSKQNIVEKIRQVKELSEIHSIEQAIKIIEVAYSEMLTYVQVGMSERELAARLEMHVRTLGATSMSFDTIIASGIRGALPHGLASDKLLEAGEFITIDFGAKVNQYCSDMTRTFVLGTPKSEKMIAIYESVKLAIDEVEKNIYAGQSTKKLDQMSREVLDTAGFGEYFPHSLGHAVGIDVHETPILNPRHDTQLETGMVITIEPGVYVEGLGGVRIEDMFLVEEGKCRNFMTLPRELIIV